MQMNIEQTLKYLQVSYADAVKKYGEGSPNTLRTGIALSNALQCTGGHRLECEGLSNKMAAISRRVHGPGHSTTKEIESMLERSRHRSVGIMNDDGIERYEALRFSAEEGRYVRYQGANFQTKGNR